MLLTVDNNAINITLSFKYDHAGRLVNTYHRINEEDSVLLVHNEYNELGQLIDKKLHSRDEENFAQRVAYRYNIRGWLTSINDPAVHATPLFSFRLKYNDPTANGGTAQYNGNISETTWKTAGSAEAGYGYEYDVMNRLTESGYYSAGKNNRFNENILNLSSPSQSAYDLNGNILYLQRTGRTGAGTFGSLDNLTYTYTGNRLTRVDDAITTAAGQDGFKELTKTASEYTYDASGNMVTDANKGITLIKYNHLNLPRVVKKSGADSIVYTYDAGGRKLRQQVYGPQPKTTTYAGEFIYENDTLRFINHEEGRIVPGPVPGPPTWEYQYHLKDHLGNVRVTFSEKTATTEHATSLEESSNTEFENYTNRNSFNLGKRTGSYSQKLTGGSNSQIGLAKSFEVNAGDAFDLEVYAKYESFDEEGTATNLNALITALTSAFSLNPVGGTGLDGQAAYNAFNGHFGAGALVDPNDIEDDEPPRAFLNYILFDENFVPIDFGFDQVSTSAEQVGASPNVAHDYLSLHVQVKQKGYLYVYLSNENPVLANVYFDDYKITHHTAIEQSGDYYAFGLTFNLYQRENSVKNNYLYNQGKDENKFNTERISDLGLEVDMTKFRAYDPSMGRWWQVDPKADSIVAYSSYNYSFNNPIRYNDPMGDCPPENPNCGGNKSILKAALQPNVSSAARATTNSASEIVSVKVGFQGSGIGGKLVAPGLVRAHAEMKYGSTEVSISKKGLEGEVSLVKYEGAVGLGNAAAQGDVSFGNYSTETGERAAVKTSGGLKAGSFEYGVVDNDVSIGATLGSLSGEVSASLTAIKETLANGVETTKQFFKNLFPNPFSDD